MYHALDRQLFQLFQLFLTRSQTEFGNESSSKLKLAEFFYSDLAIRNP